MTTNSEVVKVSLLKRTVVTNTTDWVVALPGTDKENN
jgi:hypothetical protein